MVNNAIEGAVIFTTQWDEGWVDFEKKIDGAVIKNHSPCFKICNF